jgi:hypothetical protein
MSSEPVNQSCPVTSTHIFPTHSEPRPTTEEAERPAEETRGKKTFVEPTAEERPSVQRGGEGRAEQMTANNKDARRTPPAAFSYFANARSPISRFSASFSPRASSASSRMRFSSSV